MLMLALKLNKAQAEKMQQMNKEKPSSRVSRHKHGRKPDPDYQPVRRRLFPSSTLKHKPISARRLDTAPLTRRDFVPLAVSTPVRTASLPSVSANAFVNCDDVVEHSVPVLQSLYPIDATREELEEESASCDNNAVCSEIEPPRLLSSTFICDSERGGLAPKVAGTKRARTAAARIASAREKHQMQYGCVDKCHQKCKRKITEDHRKKIHSSYWIMTYNERRIWQSRLIKREAVKRHRCRGAVVHDPVYKRTSSLTYLLPSDSGEDVVVCQKFFCATLGYTSNQFIVEMMKTSQSSHVIPPPDKRGKHEPANKIDICTVDDHIDSFNPQVSHYRREYAPNRRYLPSSVTVKLLFEDFQAKNPNFKCSMETYRKVVSAAHISFAQPDDDICDECAYYEHAEKTEEIEAESARHKSMAHKAREAYRFDSETAWPNGTVVYAADLQKVLLLPVLRDLKSCIFTSRLVVFNETFARMGKNIGSDKQNLLLVWDESTAGRKKEDIASAYHTIIDHHRDADTFVFWLDNCSAQNKNWALYSMLVMLMNSTRESPSEICLKYLVPGHTHMLADSVHGQIEKRLRRTGDIYDLNDLIDVMDLSGKRNKVLPLQIHNFRDWPNNIVARTKRNQLPLLAEIVQARFVRGDERLFYKTDLDGEEVAVDVLKKAAAFKKKSSPRKPHLATVGNGTLIFDDKLQPIRESPRGIAVSKKNKILANLAPRMPSNRRAFWQNLSESSSSEDLLKTFE